MSNTVYKSVNLPQIVGKGYADFWKTRKRYRVVKGSRASKKSKTTALNFIYNLMKYENSNLLVVRKVYSTIKDSCFSELNWAINRLGVVQLWDVKKSPLELTYIPTGQKVFFRGLDDPLKITSITVTVGFLSWGWIEEAYEVMNVDDFNILDESIRGNTGNLWKQWTITFNPWSDKHWLKKRFFDTEDDDVFTLTTNYLCNEWLDEADLRVFEKMKQNNPRRYQVAGLGNWGVTDGLVYENWREEVFDVKEVCYKFTTFFGLDFGYTSDPTAFVGCAFDENNKKLYIFDEFYEKKLSNFKIYQKIKEKGYEKESITADSSEPKSIDELKSYGLRVSGALKGKNSILFGVQFIQDLEIIIHPKCVNFLTEISTYVFDKDKIGNISNYPVDFNNHLMDALRYAVEKHINKAKLNFLKGGI